jgi:glyoxylase-like metal-dependent hydrolase (beta-lactamase superfamily II)
MLSRLARPVLAAALACSPLFLPASAQAAAPQVRTQAPGYYRVMLGAYEITALSDGTLDLPVQSLLLNTTQDKVQAALKKHYLPTPTPTSVNAFLVNTGSKLILIDTGGGALLGDGAGKLVDNLKAAGYQPDQIDEIYLTHLHGDHVGGLTLGSTAQFPKAVVRIAKEEADYWLSDDELKKASASARSSFGNARAALAPYVASHRLQTFSGEGELAPGITPRLAKGHTPGHSIYLIQSEGQAMLAMGDLVHVEAVQFDQPKVAIKFDSDPKAAVATRERIFDEAASKGYLIGAAHLSFPGMGHIAKQGAGYAWVPVPYLAQP